MNRKKKINLLNILLVITALVMFYLGIKGGIMPPTVTGIGFILIAWIVHSFNNE